MLKGFCQKKKKLMANGKVSRYCFRIKCKHLILQIKKKYKTVKRNRKWKKTFETNYG